jgi:putative transport protein
VQSFGFALFIFCVGYQAGPRFFDVLLTSGLKYLSLALVVAGTGFGLTVWLAYLMELEPGLAAGLMGGAMTTTPTLAAAQDAVRSGIFEVPAAMTADEVLNNIGAGYALTYLFGLIGLILSVRLLPRMLGVDLPAEAAKLATGEDADAPPDLSAFTRRTYRVTKRDRPDRTMREIERAAPGEVLVAGIRRNGELIDVDFDTRFELGDEVMVIGRVERLLAHGSELGLEIADAGGLSVRMVTAQVVVSDPNVIGKPIREVELDRRLGVLPLKLRRQRTELPLSLDTELRRGDVVTFHGPESAIQRVVEMVGYVELDVDETDLLTFALGVAGGIALGTLAVTFGDVTIELGTAGGLLVTGLSIGFLRSIWPVFGRVPSASRWVLMELGLLMFMAGVGLNSGGDIVAVVQESGLRLIGAGVLVTLVPVLAGYFFSTRVLKLNPAEAFGGVTGAMTSGAALSVVNAAAKSNVPALGYTGAYAFANVILAVAGTLLMLV